MFDDCLQQHCGQQDRTKNHQHSLDAQDEDIALGRFGLDNLAAGEPLGLLQQTFVPVYLYHRFQMEAAVKLVGGVDYRYNVAGDGQPVARVVPEDSQRVGA